MFIAFVCLAQQVEVSEVPVQSQDAEWLQYDDGSPHWLTWDGAYRGVWFHMEDFIPGATGYDIEAARLWFYHHTTYPWDTSDTIVEIWNGSPAAGFTDLLASQLISGVHYAPSYVEFDPPVTTEADFWCLQNTELSSGGWPSILCDGGFETPPVGIHSYYTDDTALEPLFIAGSYCNYFTAVIDNWDPAALERTSWGYLKTVF